MLKPTTQTPAQQRSAAEGTLHSYASMYGREIYQLTPQQAWDKAAEFREQSKVQEPPESLTTLCKSIHYQAIAQCLHTLQQTPE